MMQMKSIHLRFVYIVLIIGILPVFDLNAQARREYDYTVEQQYFDRLTYVEGDEFVREFENPFLSLLLREEKKYYQKLPTLEARKDYIKAYWRRNNPNPILEQNGFLVGFLKRWEFVKKTFASDFPPYFDDRGDYYLKFGEPTRRDKQQSRVESTGFGVAHSIYAHEIWDYHELHQDFFVLFMKEGKSYEQIRNPTKLNRYLRSSSSRIHNSALAWWTFLTQEGYLAAGLDRMRIEVEAVMDRAAWVALMSGKTMDTYDISRHLRNELGMQEIVRRIDESTVAPTGVAVAANVLTFFNDVTQFRDPSGATRIDISFMTPVEKNLIKSYSKAETDSLTIEYSSMIRDLTYEPIVKISGIRTIPIAAAEQENTQNAVHYLTILTAPRVGELSLQIENISDSRMGYSREYIDIRNFSGSNLMISDIRLCTEIQTENQRKLLPPLAIQGIRVAPYPYEEIKKSEPVLCYFEIYNIISGGIKSLFEISINVEWNKSREGALQRFTQLVRRGQAYSLSVTHQRNIARDTNRELIALDMSELPDGPYILSITVTDTADSTITAHVEKPITLAK